MESRDRNTDMAKLPVELRNDDVLIYGNLTSRMCQAMEHKSMFEWFKETDGWFEERNIPMILAVLTDGIDHYPEWVDYIKQRQHRYRIELHGHTHINYRHILNENKLYDLLMPAKEKLEETFSTRITRWYAPFSRGGFPGGNAEIGMRVCERMGMKFHTKGNGPIPHRHFHYWNPEGIARIKEILSTYGIK